jgi:hypothetical protein
VFFLIAKSRPLNALLRQHTTVLTRIAAARLGANLQEAYGLSAAGRNRVVGPTSTSWPIPVAFRPRPPGHGLPRAGCRPSGGDGDGRRLAGAHVVVYEVGEQLGVALRLHRATHHAEGRPEGAVFRGEAGDNGVEGCSQATAPCVPKTVVRLRSRDARRVESHLFPTPSATSFTVYRFRARVYWAAAKEAI